MMGVCGREVALTRGRGISVAIGAKTDVCPPDTSSRSFRTLEAMGKGGRRLGQKPPAAMVGKPTLSEVALQAHDAATSSCAGPSRGVCINCGVRRSARQFPSKVDNACMDCWAPFPAAFSQHGSFAEFVEKKAKCQELQEQYDQARRVIMKKEAATWAPCEVADEDAVRINRIVTMVGPSRSDLVKLLEDTTPEELGITLQSIEHPDGTTYKGLLLLDPQCPWPRFEFVTTRAVGKRSTRMDKASQLYQGQPDDSMKYLQSELLERAKFSSQLMTKMKTLPWTFDSILHKANSVRSQKGLAPLTKLPGILEGWKAGVARSALEALSPIAGNQATAWENGPKEEDGVDGADDEVEEDDEEDGVSVQGDASGAYIGIASLNSQAVLESMSVAGQTRAGKRKGPSSDTGSKGISPGGKRRVVMNPHGVPVNESDKQDLVDRRIASASVQKILGGISMGREVRWCRDTRDLFRNANETNYSEQLDQHFKVCQQAETLVDGPITKLSKNVLEVAVRTVQEADEELPVAMQWLLWKRSVAEFTESLTADSVVDFMWVICPWASRPGTLDDADDTNFDGLAPKLADICGTVEEKGNSFLTAGCDALALMLSKGENGKALLMKVCDWVLEFLAQESLCDRAEAYDSPVSQLLMACRALKIFGDPFYVAHFECATYLDNLASKRDRSTKASRLYAFHMELKANDFWWKLREEHVSRGVSSAKHIGEVKEFMAAASEQVAFVSSGALLRLLNKLPVYAKECRQGVFEPLESIGEKAMTQHLEFLKSSDGMDAERDNCAQMVADARDLLSAAMKSLPRKCSVWEAGQQFVEGVEKKMIHARTAIEFDRLAQSATLGMLSDEVQRKMLSMAIKSLARMEAEMSEQRGDQLKALADLCMEWLQTEAADETAAEIGLVLIDEMKELSCWPVVEQPFDDLVAMFRAWKPLQDAIDSFMALGSTMGERADNEDCQRALQRALVAYKNCLPGSELLRTSIAMDSVVTAHGTFLDEVYQYLHAKAKEDLAVVAAAILPTSTGCDDPDHSWTDEIPEGCSDIDAVMKVAETTLLKMNGPLFAQRLMDLKSKREVVKRWCDLFSKGWARDHAEAIDELITRCNVTKVCALMAHEYHANKANPNPNKLRRQVRKLRGSVADFHARVHPVIWRWCSDAEAF